MGSSLADLAIEPSLGHRPVALHRGGRGADDRGRLGDGQSAEKTEFDDAALLGVDGRETGERVVQRDQLWGMRCGYLGGCLGGQPGVKAAAFGGVMATDVIDQDTTHRLGGDAEEMGPALPVDPALVDEA